MSTLKNKKEQHQESTPKTENEHQDISMEDALREFSFVEYEIGKIVHGVITRVTVEGLTIDIGAKNEGFIPHDEIANYLTSNYKVGQKLTAEFISDKLEGGRVHLSCKVTKSKEDLQELLDKISEGQTFSVEITSFNKGGLTGEVGGFKVFIPASQADRKSIKDLTEEQLKEYIASFVGKTLEVRATEIDLSKGEIKASARVLLQEQWESEREVRDAVRKEQQEIWQKNKDQRNAEFAQKQAERATLASNRIAELVEGSEVEGVVMRINNFGAFVDIGGVDALLHKNNLSFDRKVTFESVLEIGKTYRFKILEIDKVNSRVSLGYKQLHEKQPWETAGDRYLVGSTHKAKALRTASFGVFLSLEPRIDALVRISEISHEFVQKIESAIEIGKVYEVQILSIDTAKKQISASIKALIPKPEPKPKEPRAEKEVLNTNFEDVLNELDAEEKAAKEKSKEEQQVEQQSEQPQEAKPARKKPTVRTTIKDSRPIKMGVGVRREGHHREKEEIAVDGLPTEWKDKEDTADQAETAFSKALKGLQDKM